MSPLELVAALLGLLAVWLIVGQRMLAWPFGIASGGLYVGIFARSRLYASALLSVFYVALQAYGWYAWWRGTGDGRPLAVSRTSPRQLTALAIVGAATTIASATILGRVTDQVMPYADSFTMAYSLVAQWMVARKQLENWAVWIVVDVVATVVYVSQGLTFTAVLYAAYLGLAVAGWRQWRASAAGPAVAVVPEGR